MSKKEICSRESIAYYSGFNGLEIKHVEYGIDDYIYCVSGCWYGNPEDRQCHKLKIYYDHSKCTAWVKLYGIRIHLGEFIRLKMGV